MKLRYLHTAVAIMLLTLVYSCSPDRNHLLDNIPSDMSSVILVNAKQINESAPDLDLGAEFEILQLSGAEIYAVAAQSASTGVAMAQCKDADAAVKGLTERGYTTATTQDDITIYTPSDNGTMVGITAEGLMLLPAGNPGSAEKWATELREMLARAAKSSFSGLKGPGNYLDNHKGLISTAIQSDIASRTYSTPEAPEAPADTLSWICANIVADGTDLGYEAQLLTTVGQQIEIPGFQTIDKTFLNYAPAGSQVAFAAGLTRNIDWSILEQVVLSTVGRSQRSMVRMIFPFLLEIDGTVAMAIASTNPEGLTADSNPDNTRILLMVHLPQEAIDNLLELTNANLESAIDPSRSGNGLYAYNVGTTTVYLGSVDGYLTFANYPLSEGGNTDLAPTFSGKNAALYVNMPNMQEVSARVPEGVGAIFTSQLDDNRMEGRVQLTNSKIGILTLINDIMKK